MAESTKGPWPALTGIASLAGACGVIVCAVLLIDLRGNRVGVWVPAKSMAYNCSAVDSTATCTFTNTSKLVVTTCVKGALSQKKAAGVGLASMPMCTGAIGPRETKAVTAPWLGGRATDMCNKENSVLGKVLDWEACDFKVDEIPEP